MMTARLVVLLVAIVVLDATAELRADNASSPSKLPPGMTEATMKMMMTPGPAHAAGIPADLKPFFGCIPTMGYHYSDPKVWPFGPIYGWYEGKPIFTEIMIDATMFAKGMSWDQELRPLPGYHIDHVDIWYEAHGHPGYPKPHYDIHAWYIPHEQHMKFCDNPSGKRPSWM